MRDAVAVGICVVSSEGDIQQRVVECESVVMRFPDPSMAAPIPLSTDYGGGDFQKIVVLEKHFEIAPNSMYVHLGDVSAGPFVTTNTVNVDPASVEWIVDSGIMTPAAGASSTLLLDQPPTENDPIVITAEAEFDEVFSAEDTTFVWLCSPHGLLLQSSTTNFSPHIGETASFTLELPGCNHATRGGWIEGELMRETTSGWQHVGWLDASQAEPGHQKRRRCLFGPQTITWNGIATEGAALADSPDVFTEGSAPFHRALPEVVSGEPVPPPYYTIFFRYREADGDTATVIDETSTTVYVPQVVKIEMADAAFEEFKRPILHPGTYYSHLLGRTDVDGCESNILIYAGSSTTSMSQLLSTVADKCAFQYPTTVNVRFTHQQTRGQTKVVRLVCAENPNEEKHGLAPLSPFQNREASGEATVYVDVVRRASSTEKYRYDNGIMQPLSGMHWVNVGTNDAQVLNYISNIVHTLHVSPDLIQYSQSLVPAIGVDVDSPLFMFKGEALLEMTLLEWAESESFLSYVLNDPQYPRKIRGLALSYLKDRFGWPATNAVPEL